MFSLTPKQVTDDVEWGRICGDSYVKLLQNYKKGSKRFGKRWSGAVDPMKEGRGNPSSSMNLWKIAPLLWNRGACFSPSIKGGVNFYSSIKGLLFYGIGPDARIVWKRTNLGTGSTAPAVLIKMINCSFCMSCLKEEAREAGQFLLFYETCNTCSASLKEGDHFLLFYERWG